MHCSQKICFHGAFRDKRKAQRKERRVHGFIRSTTIHGHRRYVVMTSKKKEKRQ